MASPGTGIVDSHALMLALQDFGGALIVVSHDRSLLESTTDAFWLVAGGKVDHRVDDAAAAAKVIARNQG